MGKAKSPAFLFYTNDFTSGTQFFTDEQIGKYVRLLCAQHQHGHLTEKQMNFICKGFDADIFAKFEKDAQGNFFQKRLEEEILKRQAHAEHQKEKANKRWSKTDTEQMPRHNHGSASAVPLENEIENEKEEVNEIENKSIRAEKKFQRPSINEICSYFSEQNFAGTVQIEAEKFNDHYESNGWKVGKNAMKDWKAAIRNWIKNYNQFTNINGKQSKSTNHEQNHNELADLAARARAAKDAIAHSGQ